MTRSRRSRASCTSQQPQISVLPDDAQRAVLVMYDTVRRLNRAVALSQERYSADPPRRSRNILRLRLDDVGRTAERPLAALAHVGAKVHAMPRVPYISESGVAAKSQGASILARLPGGRSGDLRTAFRRK
jgi:hypothetical protein